jgi:hypothetical protein
MVFGETKDMAIKFVNSTGLTISIPREGHRVKNPGGLEGWNDMTLGGSINNLAPGAARTVVQNLNVKADDDIEFEIHYGAGGDRDFTQVFTGRNTVDKNATLTLTRH